MRPSNGGEDTSKTTCPFGEKLTRPKLNYHNLDVTVDRRACSHRDENVGSLSLGKPIFLPKRKNAHRGNV